RPHLGRHRPLHDRPGPRLAGRLLFRAARRRGRARLRHLGPGAGREPRAGGVPGTPAAALAAAAHGPRGRPHRAARPVARLSPARRLGLRGARPRRGLRCRRLLCAAADGPGQPPLSAALPLPRPRPVSVWLPGAPCTPRGCVDPGTHHAALVPAVPRLAAVGLLVLAEIVLLPFGRWIPDGLVRPWCRWLVRAAGVRVRIAGAAAPT